MQATAAAKATGQPRTINEIFAQAIQNHRKDDAFAYKHNGEWIKVSHDVFVSQVRDAREGFLKLGIKRGDRLGLLSENRLEWTITDLAMLSCGGITVPIYATQTPQQITYILNDCEAEVLCLSSAKQLAKVMGELANLPHIRAIVTFDQVQRPAELPDRITFLSFEKLRQTGSSTTSTADFLKELVKAANPDDLATLIYTSGTTGEPKGVMLTHSNITSNALAGVERIECTAQDIALSYLPLSHIYERTVMYVFIFAGVSVYFAESVDAIAANLTEVKPTVMTSVPRIFEKILAKIETGVKEAGGLKAKLYAWAMENGKEYARMVNDGKPVPFFLKFQRDLGYSLVLSKIKNRIAPRVRFFSSGGAALSEEIAYSFEAMGLPILQGYGLTETSPVICANSFQDNRYGTVGKPMPGVDVKIAEDGEILARGPNIMRGYYKRPEATAEVMKDGWFHTGDIGHFDADGYLKITDRKKDLFKTSGGKYIAPQPIENKLVASHNIQQAIVIGNERKFPAVIIVPDWDVIMELVKTHGIKYKERTELLDHPKILEYFQKEVDRLTPDLASYEKPKKVVLLEQELTIEGGELTPTLKVKRRVVDLKYKDMIDKIYQEK